MQPRCQTPGTAVAKWLCSGSTKHWQLSPLWCILNSCTLPTSYSSSSRLDASRSRNARIRASLMFVRYLPLRSCVFPPRIRGLKTLLGGNCGKSHWSCPSTDEFGGQGSSAALIPGPFFILQPFQCWRVSTVCRGIGRRRRFVAD